MNRDSRCLFVNEHVSTPNPPKLLLEPVGYMESIKSVPISKLLFKTAVQVRAGSTNGHGHVVSQLVRVYPLTYNFFSLDLLTPRI